MAETLEYNIDEKGYWDADLVKYLKNVRDVVNELQADHATFKALTDELHADVNAIRAVLVSLLAKMDADFADVANASTDYAATHGVGGTTAALPAAAIAASNPAALTNSTALKLTQG